MSSEAFMAQAERQGSYAIAEVSSLIEAVEKELQAVDFTRHRIQHEITKPCQRMAPVSFSRDGTQSAEDANKGNHDTLATVPPLRHPMRSITETPPLVGKATMRPRTTSRTYSVASAETESHLITPVAPSKPRVEHSVAPRRQTSSRDDSVMQLLSILRSSPYHIVYPYLNEDGNLEDFVLSHGEVRERAFEIPRSTEAIIVLMQLDQVDLALAFAMRLKANLNGCPLPPIIALAIREDSPKKQICHERVLNLKRELKAHGVDDVLIQKNDGDELLEVKLLVAQVREFKKRKRELQQKGGEEMYERLNELFWSRAHSFFKGFPRIESETAEITLRPGVRINSYTVGNMIGSGGYASVHSALNFETGTTEAIKCISKCKLRNLHNVEAVWRELTWLMVIDSPYVARCYWATQTNYAVLLFMQYAGDQNMCKVIKQRGQLAFSESVDVQSKILRGLAHCHSHGVAHRDIKPENICISEERGQTLQVKIIDLGCAVDKAKPCRDLQGTMPFMAPEVMGANSKRPYMPAPTDVWASSVVFLESLGGIGVVSDALGWPRKASPSDELLMQLVRYLTWPTSIRDTLQPIIGDEHLGEIHDILKHTLQVNADGRPEAREVVAKIDLILSPYRSAQAEA